MKYLLSALATVLMICITANAEEVTFSFRGTLHELDGEYSFFTGQPFEITYSFESETHDADPDNTDSGSYVGAIRSGAFTIYIGGKSFNWVVEPDGPHNIIEVKNLETEDSYSAGVAISDPVDGSEIPASFLVQLIDGGGTAISSDALPLSLEMSSFNHSIVQFTFIGRRQSVYSTWGIITSGNVPVPNPRIGSNHSSIP
jgi:hypothetical protein